ncbi:nucleotidyltransferase [soil metagenome]
MKGFTSPTLLVLAAGMGSRYGGLKQLDPVGPAGETIIDYSIYDAVRAGFGKIVFVIRKEIEQQFRERIGKRFEGRVPVEYVFQELDALPAGFSVPAGRRKPWGTAHAILVAADAVREPFAVINADDFYGADSYKALAQHLETGTEDQAMVAFVLSRTLSEFGAVSRGICDVGGDGYLRGVREMTKLERDGRHARNFGSDGRVTALTGEELVSMNMWGFTPQVFEWLRNYFEEFLIRNGSDLQAECYLPSMVDELVEGGLARVKVLRTPASWFGITYRDDLPRVVEKVRALVEQGHYPEKLW